jgi:hypothetical protein
MAVLTGAGVPAPIAMKLAGFTDEQVKEAFPQGLQPPQSALGGLRTPPGTIVRNVNAKPAIQVG